MSIMEFLYLIGVSFVIWQNICFYVDNKESYKEKYPLAFIAGAVVISLAIELTVLTVIFLFFDLIGSVLKSWLLNF